MNAQADSTQSFSDVIDSLTVLLGSNDQRNEKNV